VFLSIRSKPPAVAPGKEPELAVSGHCDSEGKLWIRLRSTCVFITAVPITKLFAWGEGILETCATRDDEPRPVWTSLQVELRLILPLLLSHNLPLPRVH
jgi:hypothetical protein